MATPPNRSPPIVSSSPPCSPRDGAKLKALLAEDFGIIDLMADPEVPRACSSRRYEQHKLGASESSEQHVRPYPGTPSSPDGR